MKTKFDAVIFDLFGTLVPFVGSEEFQSSLLPTAALLGCPVEALEKAWCSREAFTHAVTTVLTPEALIESFCEQSGRRASAEVISKAAQTRYDAHRGWLIPKPTSLHTLATLRTRGYRLGLMSTCSIEAPTLWPETEFKALFDQALFSCEIGLSKAEDSFYLRLCQGIGAIPTRTIYMGDTRSELMQAKGLGMLPILMRTRVKTDWDGLTISEPAELLDLLETFEGTTSTGSG